MELNHYQEEARTFAVYPDKGDNIVYPALGLIGEAGEVANQVKKVLRDDNGEVTNERFDKLADELGDVLWYIANEATELGTTLEHIANYNLCKLRERRRQDQISGDKRSSESAKTRMQYLTEPDDDSYDPMGGS